jgi:ribosome biogenesis GTPase A
MEKRSVKSNVEFINKVRTAKCVSDNILNPAKQGWDYSFLLLMGGVLKLAETGQFHKERHKAAEFSAWLAEETMRRIYRFKYSKARDNIHVYIRNFLDDHQQGKLKRWIFERIHDGDDYVTIKTNLLGDYQD